MNPVLWMQFALTLFDYIERVSKNVNGPEPTKEELDARDAVRAALVAEANKPKEPTDE